MKGVSGLHSRLSALPGRCSEKVLRVQVLAAEKVLASARKRAPVRTGRLRASLQQGLQPPSARVMASCDYAAFVEGGTRHMKARPFLRPAFAENDYAACVAQAIREAID